MPQIWLFSYLKHRLNTRTTGSFSFQNAFFYLQWSDDDQVVNFHDPITYNLVTLKKTRRKTKLHPHKQRSKYICKPELVIEAGNHFVWEFIPGHGKNIIFFQKTIPSEGLLLMVTAFLILCLFLFNIFTLFCFSKMLSFMVVLCTWLKQYCH